MRETSVRLNCQKVVSGREGSKMQRIRTSKKEEVQAALNFAVLLKQETSHNNKSRIEHGVCENKLKDWSGVKGDVWD